MLIAGASNTSRTPAMGIETGPARAAVFNVGVI